MYLLADSIAYDAAFQYRALRALGCDVEVFVERFDAGNYADGRLGRSGISLRRSSSRRRARRIPASCA